MHIALRPLLSVASTAVIAATLTAASALTTASATPLAGATSPASAVASTATSATAETATTAATRTATTAARSAATAAATRTATAAAAARPAASGRKAFRGRTQHGSFTSTAWPGHTVRWRAAVPVGVPSATVIVLHGRSDDSDKAFDGLDLRRQAHRTGMAIVTVDGGDNFWTCYGGIDTGRMVTDELVRALRDRGLPVDRYALSGYSMGGLGAMLIAQRVGPTRVFAVAPMSSAVWEGGKGGAEGQAQAHVRRDAAALARIPVRLVCGTSDALYGVNRSMAQLLPHASTSWTGGDHDFAYWRPVFAQQLDWIARQA